MADGPLLLDTHCWLWMEGGFKDRFSERGREAIQEAAEARSLFVSVISVWEVAMLESKGRISLGLPCEQWVKEALAAPGLTLAALTPEIAVHSTRLPGSFHGDPADRLIAATARWMGARLLTGDRRILEYGRAKHLTVIHA